MIYLETGSVDPAYNLAFEEVVLRECRAGDYLILWQNQSTVVVGQNQNPLEEIDLRVAEQQGVRVIRRSTGGGAVYHDLGNLNYSFLTDAGDPEKLSVAAFAETMAAALRELGLPAEATGRNDILVGGKKVSGTAQRLAGGRLLHHGTLLFASDLDLLGSVLRSDPEKFRSKSSKSTRSRVGNIRDLMEREMDMHAFWEYLRQYFSGTAPAAELTAAELAEVQRLKAEKYDTWEWTFGHAPAYELTNRCRWEGGSLAVSMSVDCGRIHEIAFRGDFLSRKNVAEVERALRGTCCRRDALLAALGEFSLPDYFGSITAAEIAETILMP